MGSCRTRNPRRRSSPHPRTVVPAFVVRGVVERGIVPTCSTDSQARDSNSVANNTWKNDVNDQTYKRGQLQTRTTRPLQTSTVPSKMHDAGRGSEHENVNAPNAQESTCW